MSRKISRDGSVLLEENFPINYMDILCTISVIFSILYSVLIHQEKHKNQVTPTLYHSRPERNK